MFLKVNLTIEGVEDKCQFEVGCTIYMMGDRTRMRGYREA